MHSNQYISSKHQCKYGGMSVVATSFMRHDRDHKGYSTDTGQETKVFKHLVFTKQSIQNSKLENIVKQATEEPKGCDN